MFHLRPDEVRAPYGVEVAQVIPGTIALDIEKSGRRTIPIVPALDGEPAPGFVIGGVTSDPAAVEVAGPESRLRQLTGATTEPVEMTGSRSRVRDVVTVGISDSAVRLVQPQNATVLVEVLPAPVERELSGVPVRWRHLGTGLRALVQPSLTRITVRGKREALADLRAGTIDAFVDLAGLGPGRYTLRVQIDPSQAFGVSAMDPAVVDVTIN
jgi:YbbR domain-containing protein